jgi:hypothetical protein
MKTQHVHDWALTQDFSLVESSEVANRLRANRVDGEILSNLETNDIEEYLGFSGSIAIKIHDAINPLLGLVDLTHAFGGQKDQNEVDAEGKQSLVRCCCIDDESLPGKRKRCDLVRRQISWREFSVVGLGCGDIGYGWHSHTWWDNGKSLIPSSQAMQSGSWGVKSSGALSSAVVLLSLLAIIFGVGSFIRSFWLCWKFVQGNPVLTQQCVLPERIIYCLDELLARSLSLFESSAKRL